MRLYYFIVQQKTKFILLSFPEDSLLPKEMTLANYVCIVTKAYIDKLNLNIDLCRHRLLYLIILAIVNNLF